jgi:kynurenine formamidase
VALSARPSSWRRFGWLLAVGASLGAQPQPVPALRDSVIDLTYPFDAGTIYWPADRHFERKPTAAGMTPGGYWYASAEFAASEHGGTHLDSPLHFARGRRSVDQIPLSDLIGPAVVVDIREAAGRDRDYQLTVADLERWEARYGQIPRGSIVLVRTGWGKYWPDKRAYLGTDKPGDTANLHFPGISETAAEWLVRRRAPRGVGIDTASIDHGPSKLFRAHQVFCSADIYALENVANLDQLPATGATLIALPMKIAGGTGAPTRLIALLGETGSPR